MEYQLKQPYTSFKRYCKTLTLRKDPELIEAYRKIHQPGETWPEVSRGMKEVGILDMEIYISGTLLFMIMDTLPDFEHDRAMEELASKPRQKEWEAFVARFQETPASATADEKWQPMERIYKLDP
jgi:L-rhamnose mutarotase